MTWTSTKTNDLSNFVRIIKPGRSNYVLTIEKYSSCDYVLDQSLLFYMYHVQKLKNYKNTDLKRNI